MALEVYCLVLVTWFLDSLCCACVGALGGLAIGHFIGTYFASSVIQIPLITPLPMAHASTSGFHIVYVRSRFWSSFGVSNAPPSK